MRGNGISGAVEKARVGDVLMVVRCSGALDPTPVHSACFWENGFSWSACALNSIEIRVEMDMK